jgi:hypothetical protein
MAVEPRARHSASTGVAAHLGVVRTLPERLTVRRLLIALLLLMPLVMWVAMESWVSSNMDQWITSEAELSLPTRLAILTHHWSIRMAPLAMLAVFLLSPFLSLAVAALAGCFRAADAAQSKRALLMWWSASVAVLGFTALLTAFRDVAQMAFALPITLLWAAFLCHSISLGSAVALQRSRVAAGSSTLTASWVIIIAALFQYLGGVPALLVPFGVWVASRRDKAATVAVPS